MSRKRIVFGILFLIVGLGIFGFYVWGVFMASAVEGMFSTIGAPATTSYNIFGRLAPAAAVISLAIALWLLLGPATRKLLSSMRRGRSDR
jgi:uncharacterized membrane protein YphA (DoxX/SURF4 family)